LKVVGQGVRGCAGVMNMLCVVVCQCVVMYDSLSS